MSEIRLEANETLVAFVVARPAEKLDVRDQRRLIFVSVIPQVSAVGRAHFKKTRGVDRKRKRSLEIAEAIGNGLELGEAVAVMSRQDGHFVQWATEMLNEVRPLIGAEWEVEGASPTHFKWKSIRVDLKAALGIAAYASVLPVIGLSLGERARSLGFQRAALALDLLPGLNSESMELLQAIMAASPTQGEMWDVNAKGLSGLHIANLGSYTDADGRLADGKTHPGFSLADWMAVACAATHDAARQFPDVDHDVVSDYAAPWTIATVEGRARTLDLEAPSLIDQIKAHGQSGGKTAQ